MFLKLTQIDDVSIYINFNTVEVFLNNQGVTEIFSSDDHYPIKVKETPEQIMEMLNKHYVKTNECKDCGIEVSTGSVRCKQCREDRRWLDI